MGTVENASIRKRRSPVRELTWGGAAVIMLALASRLSLVATSLQPLLPAHGFADELKSEPCSLSPGPTRAVVRVLDAETIVLDDGSEVRLIGALAPRLPEVAAGAPVWPPERDAEAALSELILGRSVELGFAGRRTDRHGRLLAHVFLNSDAGRIWVQGHLLSHGHARAYGLPESTSCLTELLAHERLAREGRTGLWSNAAYQERGAYRTYELLRYRNTFQIVRGRVTNAAETKKYVYLNFGSDWRQDFTAGVPLRSVGRSPALLEWLKALKGRSVRVRGWIERRNGPFIEVTDPMQIEVVDHEALTAGSRLK